MFSYQDDVFVSQILFKLEITVSSVVETLFLIIISFGANAQEELSMLMVNVCLVDTIKFLISFQIFVYVGLEHLNLKMDLVLVVQLKWLILMVDANVYLTILKEVLEFVRDVCLKQMVQNAEKIHFDSFIFRFFSIVVCIIYSYSLKHLFY